MPHKYSYTEVQIIPDKHGMAVYTSLKQPPKCWIRHCKIYGVRMYRIVYPGGLASDMVNLSRAKDAARLYAISH